MKQYKDLTQEQQRIVKENWQEFIKDESLNCFEECKDINTFWINHAEQDYSDFCYNAQDIINNSPISEQDQADLNLSKILNDETMKELTTETDKEYNKRLNKKVVGK